MKNWENTIQTIPGTLKTDKDGKIEFKMNQFGKYSATLKVADDDPWSVLERKTTWIYIDSLFEKDVVAFKKLEADGKLNGETRVIVTGHLVRTPGNPGMNDLFNLKMMSTSPANDKQVVYSLDEALTKEEWQVIYKEKKARNAGSGSAPTAPVAPAAPF